MAIFDSVQELLDEGEVPYFSLTIVMSMNQEGARHSCYRVEGDAPLPVIVGELEMFKLYYIRNHDPNIRKRIVDEDK